jgi:hypothetical protein
MIASPALRCLCDCKTLGGTSLPFCACSRTSTAPGLSSPGTDFQLPDLELCNRQVQDGLHVTPIVYAKAVMSMRPCIDLLIRPHLRIYLDACVGCLPALKCRVVMATHDGSQHGQPWAHSLASSISWYVTIIIPRVWRWSMHTVRTMGLPENIHRHCVDRHHV